MRILLLSQGSNLLHRGSNFVLKGVFFFLEIKNKFWLFYLKFEFIIEIYLKKHAHENSNYHHIVLTGIRSLNFNKILKQIVVCMQA